MNTEEGPPYAREEPPNAEYPAALQRDPLIVNNFAARHHQVTLNASPSARGGKVLFKLYWAALNSAM